MEILMEACMKRAFGPMTDKFGNVAEQGSRVIVDWAQGAKHLDRFCSELMKLPGATEDLVGEMSDLLKQPGTAMVTSVSARGPERARQAADSVVARSQFEGLDLRTAKSVMVCVAGQSKETCLTDAREVMRRLGDDLEVGATTMLHFDCDASLANTLRVSVLMTGLDLPGSTMLKN